MARTDALESVIEAERRNAVAAWLLVVFVAVAAAESAAGGDWIWAGFAAAVVHRRITVMLPWEVLALAVLPLLGRSFATVPLTSRFATYLSVAAVALIIAVELHLFTPVRMSPGFAVLFVVVATMATAGVWAVVRWTVDIVLETGFLLDPTLSEVEIENRLMWEFVWSTVAGVVAGAVFEGYFRRRRMGDRLPGEAAE